MREESMGPRLPLASMRSSSKSGASFEDCPTGVTAIIHSKVACGASDVYFLTCVLGWIDPPAQLLSPGAGRQREGPGESGDPGRRRAAPGPVTGQERWPDRPRGHPDAPKVIQIAQSTAFPTAQKPMN